jgi:hypothetical protein
MESSGRASQRGPGCGQPAPTHEVSADGAPKHCNNAALKWMAWCVRSRRPCFPCLSSNACIVLLVVDCLHYQIKPEALKI